MKLQLAAIVMLPFALSIGCSSDPAAPSRTETKLDPDSVRALENAEVFQVLSLDPRKIAVVDEHDYDGYYLLGSVDIKDNNSRRLVTRAIHESANQGSKRFSCFEPRHLVRVTSGGSRLDFAICFECKVMYVRNSRTESASSYPISLAGKAALDKVLSDAGVPLAK